MNSCVCEKCGNKNCSKHKLLKKENSEPQKSRIPTPINEPFCCSRSRREARISANKIQQNEIQKRNEPKIRFDEKICCNNTKDSLLNFYSSNNEFVPQKQIKISNSCCSKMKLSSNSDCCYNTEIDTSERQDESSKKTEKENIKTIDFNIEKLIKRIEDSRKCSCSASNSKSDTKVRKSGTIPVNLTFKRSGPEIKVSKSLCSCLTCFKSSVNLENSEQIILPEVKVNIGPEMVQTIQIDVKPSDLYGNDSGIITIPVQLRFGKPCPAKEGKPCPNINTETSVSGPKYSQKLVFEACEDKEYFNEFYMEELCEEDRAKTERQQHIAGYLFKPESVTEEETTKSVELIDSQCPEYITESTEDSVKSSETVQTEPKSDVAINSEPEILEPKWYEQINANIEEYLLEDYCTSTGNIGIQTDLVLGDRLFSDSLNSLKSDTSSPFINTFCKCGKRDTSVRHYINWNKVFLPTTDEILFPEISQRQPRKLFAYYSSEFPDKMDKKSSLSTSDPVEEKMEMNEDDLEVNENESGPQIDEDILKPSNETANEEPKENIEEKPAVSNTSSESAEVQKESINSSLPEPEPDIQENIKDKTELQSEVEEKPNETSLGLEETIASKTTEEEKPDNATSSEVTEEAKSNERSFELGETNTITSKTTEEETKEVITEDDVLSPTVPEKLNFVYCLNYGKDEPYVNSLWKEFPDCESEYSILPWRKILLPEIITIRKIQKLKPVKQVGSSKSTACICRGDTKSCICINTTKDTKQKSSSKSLHACRFIKSVPCTCRKKSKSAKITFDRDQINLNNTPVDSKTITYKYLNKNMKESESSKPEFQITTCSCVKKVSKNRKRRKNCMDMRIDPVVAAFQACEAELKPVREALNQVKRNLKKLNMPELDCIFKNQTDFIDTPIVKKYCKCKRVKSKIRSTSKKTSRSKLKAQKQDKKSSKPVSKTNSFDDNEFFDSLDCFIESFEKPKQTSKYKNELVQTSPFILEIKESPYSPNVNERPRKKKDNSKWKVYSQSSNTPKSSTRKTCCNKIKMTQNMEGNPTMLNELQEYSKQMEILHDSSDWQTIPINRERTQNTQDNSTWRTIPEIASWRTAHGQPRFREQIERSHRIEDNSARRRDETSTWGTAHAHQGFNLTRQFTGEPRRLQGPENNSTWRTMPSPPGFNSIPLGSNGESNTWRTCNIIPMFSQDTSGRQIRETLGSPEFNPTVHSQTGENQRGNETSTWRTANVNTGFNLPQEIIGEPGRLREHEDTATWRTIPGHPRFDPNSLQTGQPQRTNETSTWRTVHVHPGFNLTRQFTGEPRRLHGPEDNSTWRTIPGSQGFNSIPLESTGDSNTWRTPRNLISLFSQDSSGRQNRETPGSPEFNPTVRSQIGELQLRDESSTWGTAHVYPGFNISGEIIGEPGRLPGHEDTTTWRTIPGRPEVHPNILQSTVHSQTGEPQRRNETSTWRTANVGPGFNLSAEPRRLHEHEDNSTWRSIPGSPEFDSIPLESTGEINTWRTCNLIPMFSQDSSRRQNQENPTEFHSIPTLPSQSFPGTQDRSTSIEFHSVPAISQGSSSRTLNEFHSIPVSSPEISSRSTEYRRNVTPTNRPFVTSTPLAQQRTDENPAISLGSSFRTPHEFHSIPVSSPEISSRSTEYRPNVTPTNRPFVTSTPLARQRTDESPVWRTGPIRPGFNVRRINEDGGPTPGEERLSTLSARQRTDESPVWRTGPIRPGFDIQRINQDGVSTPREEQTSTPSNRQNTVSRPTSAIPVSRKCCNQKSCKSSQKTSAVPTNPVSQKCCSKENKSCGPYCTNICEHSQKTSNNQTESAIVKNKSSTSASKHKKSGRKTCQALTTNGLSCRYSKSAVPILKKRKQNIESGIQGVCSTGINGIPVQSTEERSGLVPSSHQTSFKPCCQKMKTSLIKSQIGSHGPETAWGECFEVQSTTKPNGVGKTNEDKQKSPKKCVCVKSEVDSSTPADSGITSLTKTRIKVCSCGSGKTCICSESKSGSSPSPSGTHSKQCGCNKSGINSSTPGDSGITSLTKTEYKICDCGSGKTCICSKSKSGGVPSSSGIQSSKQCPCSTSGVNSSAPVDSGTTNLTKTEFKICGCGSGKICICSESKSGRFLSALGISTSCTTSGSVEAVDSKSQNQNFSSNCNKNESFKSCQCKSDTTFIETNTRNDTDISSVEGGVCNKTGNYPSCCHLSSLPSSATQIISCKCNETAVKSPKKSNKKCRTACTQFTTISQNNSSKYSTRTEAIPCSQVISTTSPHTRDADFTDRSTIGTITSRGTPFLHSTMFGAELFQNSKNKCRTVCTQFTTISQDNSSKSSTKTEAIPCSQVIPTTFPDTRDADFTDRSTIGTITSRATPFPHSTMFGAELSQRSVGTDPVNFFSGNEMAQEFVNQPNRDRHIDYSPYSPHDFRIGSFQRLLSYSDSVYSTPQYVNIPDVYSSSRQPIQVSQQRNFSPQSIPFYSIPSFEQSQFSVPNQEGTNLHSSQQRNMPDRNFVESPPQVSTKMYSGQYEESSEACCTPMKRNKGIQKTGSLYKLRRRKKSQRSCTKQPNDNCSSVSTLSHKKSEDYIKPSSVSTEPKISKR